MKIYLSKILTGLFLIFLILTINKGFANDPLIQFNEPVNKINDGPYIFYENDTLTVQWIKKDKVKTKYLTFNNQKFLNRKFDIQLNTEFLKKVDTSSYSQEYKNVEKIIAISDIHGQYELAVKLLQQHNVIDKKNNWIYGSGHVVFLGDIFDRGDKVTELLWLVYKLEYQAKLQNGMVHYLFGNHEEMVLNNDLRYINSKYLETSKKLEVTYDKLYANNTVIGKWLRTKPLAISINDILFTHAGISPEFIDNGLTQKKVNKIFSEDIIDGDMMKVLKDTLLNFIISTNGPLWYRGYYFNNDFSENILNTILNHLNVNHIVIGHTSLPNITTLYSGKVIGIDSSIKNGDYGEIFIYENGQFFRGTSNGNKIKL